MGTYLNPGTLAFQEALASEIYIDKTGMIKHLNRLVRTKQKYLCVSRPRRFGKTMSADMISAYYDREADSRQLFENCLLGRLDQDHKMCEDKEKADPELPWDTYLAAFDVIRLVMTDFFNGERTVDEAISTIKKRILFELEELYPSVRYDLGDFYYSLDRFYKSSKIQYVVIIDEWDAIFREYKEDKDSQKQYLDFLRSWLKDKDYIALAYMTGILPIKKYGKHSALNMFREFSMTQPQQLAPYMGFTSEEVMEKCGERKLDYAGFKNWYDGYRLSNKVSEEMVSETETVDSAIYREYEVYSPYSVVNAMLSRQFANYWNQTESYEALRQYIDWDFDGLKEEIALLMSGHPVSVDITGYQNDMTTFHGKDDIKTMLIHLGYLGYHRDSKNVFIPNQEVLEVFKTSTRTRDWTMTFRALANSRRLLEATWACDSETAARLIEAAHDRAFNKSYHSEAGLSYAVQLAYYSAQDYYTIIPEFDRGKGYADLVMIPKKPNIPAILIELKYEKNGNSAMDQIHRQRYPDRLEHYKGNLILVGINYDKAIKNDQQCFKHHSCVIERA